MKLYSVVMSFVVLAENEQKAARVVEAYLEDCVLPIKSAADLPELWNTADMPFALNENEKNIGELLDNGAGVH